MATKRDLSMYTEDSVANYNSAYQYQRWKGASDEDAHSSASGLLEMRKPTTTNTPAPTVNNNRTTTTSSSNSNNSNSYSSSNNSNNYSSSNNNYSSNTSSSRNQNYNYDPNETLDTNKFWATDGKVVVKEWTAQQTWKPDYELNSDARMQEITNNLNAYWQNNREFFKDRATFNQMFSYNSRSNEQKALLDSYWKKKEDESNIAKYTNADSLANWMKNAEITTDQMDLLRANNPELYAQWQKKQQDDIDLRIANFTTPADPTDNAELFNSLIKKLNLEPWDPYQIYDNWYNMAERLGVFKDSEELKSYQAQLNENHSKMEAIMWRYASSAWWTVSDALAAARMQKALAPYQQREVDLQNAYTTLLNGRNSNLAIANQSAQALAMQAQEDQRIFNQRLSWLWFAMTTASYRTPEQQAQLQLQTQAISNDMALLQQSKMNDLSLYNQYATAKLNNQLNSELTDLSVTDPVQQRANLNNVLSQYYAQWWDIIQRPQSQVVDDVLAYAQKNGVSVAEALRKNFVEPLQNKKEYKQKIASSYGMLSQQSIWTVNWRQVIMTTNPNWTISYKYIDDPASVSGGKWAAKPYTQVDSRALNPNPVSTGYTGKTLYDFISNPKNQEWKTWWQCGKFVNDYLESIGVWRYYDNELSTKINSVNTTIATEWAIAVFDYNHKSSDWVNYWHVAIVTKVYNDWSFDVIDSNYDVKNPWKITKRHVPAWTSSLKWFFDPSQPASVTSTASNLSSIDEAKKQNYLEEARRWQMTDSNVTKIWDLAATQWWDAEWREALKQGMQWNLTDTQIKRMDKTDATFNSNPIVKEFQEAVNQIQQLQIALNDSSWVWDMSAIFTFMKTLDPSSVVRESEFQSAANTAWVLNSNAILQKIEKSYDWKFLTPQQRQDFKKIAKEFIRVKANNYQVQYNDLAKRYEQYWIDVNTRWPTNLAEQVMSVLDGWATWPSSDKERYWSWQYSTSWGQSNSNYNDYQTAASFIINWY